MPTPSELFRAAIERLELTKTAAGERIGVPYYKVHRWTQGKEFGPANRTKAALGLGLAPDAFDQPEAAEQRELERQRVYLAFLRRPIARELPDEARRVLESMRFHDDSLRPSVALYEAIALYLSGQISGDEVRDAAEFNDAIDRQ